MSIMEWWGMQNWQLMSRNDSILMQGRTGNEPAIELPFSSPMVFLQLSRI